MNVKNIALLLFVSCFSVAINAMSQAESITRNFIEDCTSLSVSAHFQRIKGGSIGIEQGKKLTDMCNKNYESNRSPCTVTLQNLGDAHYLIKAMPRGEARHMAAIKEVQSLRAEIAWHYDNIALYKPVD